MLQITRDDLQPVLAVHQGTQALRVAVEGAGPPPRLRSGLARCIQFHSPFGPGPATEDAMDVVWEGYGVGASLEEARLFRAMGFHTGSEILADQEFVVLDQTLRARRPDMVAALEKMKIPILGERHNAYYWVRIHTGVEAEHFDAALKGVNNALRFYAGREPVAMVTGWI